MTPLLVTIPRVTPVEDMESLLPVEEFRKTLWNAFPFRSGDESFSLEISELASDDVGVLVTLNAVTWTDGPMIQDVRQQDVRLLYKRALPVETSRLERYLAAVERLVSAANRATCVRNQPADWFDAELLEGAEPSESELLAALQPEAMATRQMIRWLSSGFEYGAPPTSITLWDRRIIRWPPTDDERELFLFRYQYASGARGVGLVGSVTFSSSTVSADGTVEDALAAHCMRELGLKGDLSVGRKLLRFA
jgi:hypothetical protein